MDSLKQYYEKNKYWLFFSMVAVFVWGMMAHGYAFFDGNFTHDSLNEFHGGVLGNIIKMSSGRVFTPVYRDLFRSDLTLPWLIGVLALIWLGIALFFLLKLFRIQSRLVAFLAAGILTTNSAVFSTAATYLHDLDCYMFAVMCAAAAVYCWRSLPKGWLLGVPLLTVVLGIYQGYLFVAVTLVMMVCILDLLDGMSFQQVFTAGLRAILMILISGGLYFAVMRVRLYYAGLELYNNDYNSMYVALKLTPQALPALIGAAYRDCFSRLWNTFSAYPGIMVKGITGVLALVGAGSAAVGLCSRRVSAQAKALCLVLLALLPLGMNMIYVLTQGYVHDLMVYPIWLIYLFVLLLSERLTRLLRQGTWQVRLGGFQKALCLLLVALQMYGSVQFANGLYLKKDLEFDAYLSFMTRVVDRMEMHEDYVPGQTPVAFVGLPEKNSVLYNCAPGMEEFAAVIGAQSADVIYMNERSRYQAYFDYVLGMPLQLPEQSVWDQVLQCDTAKQMPSYPSAGCIVMEDGIMIVKLGDNFHNLF